jgi:uncharacterized protein involved in exopolysaccharide biosynthesis
VGDQSTERQEVKRSVNPAYQRLTEERLLQQAAVQALEKKRQTLLDKQSDLIAEVTQLNENEQEIRSLVQEVGILETRYLSHSEKLEQARMDEMLERQRITSVNIVQPASLEHRPITPRKALCGLLGMFAATLLALGVPMLLESVRQPVQPGQDPLWQSRPPARPRTLKPFGRRASDNQEAGVVFSAVGSGDVESGPGVTTIPGIAPGR